ncbi:MAG: hypothetical protein AAF226_09625 [Verrucomicrobiota bacterium]
MKRFLMILAILAMGGSVIVGILNRNDLIQTQDDLKKASDLYTELGVELGATEDARDQAKIDEAQAKDERNQASAAVEQVRQDLKIVQRKVDDVESGLKKAEVQQKEVDLAIAKMFPDGIVKSVDEFQMILTMHKNELAEKQGHEMKLAQEQQVVEGEKTTATGNVGKEEEYQMERKRKLLVSQLVATVASVNRDYGFVIVNVGKNHGVQPDSSLLVKNGNVRVGRLRITELYDNYLVCAIVKGSISANTRIRPGDKVIFENAFASR